MANLLGTTVNGALFASGRISVTYDTDKYQFNFLRASGSNWWVTNDSTTLGLHVNNVGDRFYFSTAGDFYSDTNGWLSTALAGKSNVGHTHDDRYYTETESDGRFQPLENQRLSTTNSPTFVDVYANEWFRNNNSNEGLYNTTTTQHWSSQANGYWDASSTTSVSAIRFYTGGHVTSLRGHIYANSSNEIGFLNSAGNWGLRMDNSYNVQVYGALTVGNGTSSDIYMTDTDEGNRRIHCNSGRIGFLSSTNSWGSWAANDGSWNSDQSMRAPIFYDSNDTSYYLDPNSTSRLLNVQTIGYVGFNGNQTRDKLRVWDSGAYAIGMKNGYDYGHLGTDEYAMSFQMNDNSGRGFWWGDESHNDNQGAASLTTDGRMVIAKSLSIGEGEAVVSPSSTPLYVKGTTSGADVVGVDGINGRLFTVTDDLSGSLFSVNTIAGLPVIEAFADNTVTIGKYGYATTWSTTGFMTVPNSANIYRDLFINGGRSGDFGNRLIIGTDAATYTMNDSNQRPTAYLHGQYPVLTLNHTVTSNGSHGPTIQFTHHTADKQWVIGSNGTGTRLDIGYSTNTNRNPHNGIDDLNGSTFIRVDNSGNVQLGRGNGRSTWVNDTLYVGASDSGDSHMYFGEDSSGWYGLHWYWDSGYIVYLYGRNAGTDTEIMRYTTNNNTYVEWRRHFNMNNYEINYVSQLHFNNNTRFVNNSANYLNFQIGSDSYGSIQVRDNSNNVKGYLGYFDSSGFGLLNSSGSWGIRLAPGNVETELFYAGNWRVRTGSAGIGVNGNVYIDQNFGFGIVGLYSSTRYQGVFAMGDSYKLAADGTGTGTLYGIAWTHTNVGGQSKSGLGHQALFMDSGVTQTAIGSGIWTNGLITTTSYGTSADWNTAFGWGNHASAGYIVKGTQVLSAASWTTATRFGSVGNISQDAGNHALSVRSEDGNDAFMSFHIGNDYAVHFGLDRVSNRMHVGGWSENPNKYQIWDSRDFTSTNISNWNTAYGWGNHASAGYITGNQTITLSGVVTGSGTTAITTAIANGAITNAMLANGAVANLSGTNTGDQTNISGNASTVTHFASRTDGTAYNVVWASGNGSHMYSCDAVTIQSSTGTLNATNLAATRSYAAIAPTVASTNWNTSFGNTPVSTMAWGGDISAGGPTGTWWFQVNMRHSNSSNLWGTQLAYGWEDNANEIYQRNVTGGTFSGWVRYINTNNFASILDARYYTETEISNFFSGATAITGYNKSNWDTAYGWGNHAGLYAAASHTHTIANVTGLQTALDGKQAAGSYAAASHTHAISDVINLASALNSKLGTSDKAADSELIDGIDSSRIIYGDGPRGSTYVSSMNDPNQKSGFFFKDGPTGQPFGDWWNWLTVAGNSWQSSNNYSFQISHAFHSDDAYIRRMTNGTAYSWRTLITSGNIGSQSVNYATSAGSATSSTTATTANRLERYGVIYGNNWNDYYLNNRFIVASAHNATGTNKPDPAYNYGSMMSYYNSGEDHYQIYVTENSVNSNGKDRKMYYRSGWNGSWGGWRSVVDVYNSVCYIDAAITATGDITAFSDGRVKENVETLEGALDKTLKLRGVSYNRTDIEDKSTKIGVIAQEILEVVPEVVSQDENGMYAVSYGNITALLIEAIKEQQKQIDELKEIINGLTK